MTKTCGFDEAWIGKCKESVIPDGDRCEKHSDLKCRSCGSSATHSCEETGQFVCGVKLCDNCEHTIHEDGTNGGVGFNAESPPEGMNEHCKKTDQKYTPWLERRK